MNYINVIVNFLPIILLFLLVSYTPEFAKFSHTILGKLFAIMIIIFYVKTDKLAGLLVCLIIIFYYQTDYIESFNTMLNSDTERFENLTDRSENLTDSFKNLTERFENPEPLERKPAPEVRNVEDEYSRPLETIQQAYPIDTTKAILSDKSKDAFRKTHCSRCHLMHYGQVVKNDMTEHVYPEIQINDDFHKCNVCDPSCDFTVMERKIAAENDLMKPKSSNEMFSTVWENMRKTVGDF